MASKAEQADGAAMSDRMTNVEIEDVLSSIRRLVSEDGRAPVRSRAPAVPDKLVLTPALRIVPDAPAEPVAVPEATAPDASLSDLIAEESAAAFDALSHRAAAAALEAALSSQPDDWEPDGSEVTSQSAETWTVEWEAGADSAPPAPTFVSTRQASASPHQPAPAPVAEAAPAEPYDHLDWVDAPSGPSAAMPLEDELPAVDEETLRDLIRDILREELQGPLGERITRNVRKLVRAEIARALATRDFD
jgi:hypothetical protein